MKSILLEINMLLEGNEKKFLLQSYYSAKRYIKEKDANTLKTIVSRLNGLYPGMSKKAQEISLMIVNEIKKAEETKWTKG